MSDTKPTEETEELTQEETKELTKEEKEQRKEDRIKFMIRYHAIAKLMSVKNIKEILKKNGIKFPSNASQSDLQKLFYSHNLKINEKDLEEEIAKEEAKEKAKAEVAKAKAEAKAKAKAEAKAKAKAEEKAEAEAKSKPLTEPKEELVMTLNIKGHGFEYSEFPPSSQISKYYKNNVRVHSMACFPGVVAVAHVNYERIDDVESSYFIFNEKPECATEEIMKEYSATKDNNYKQMLNRLEKHADIDFRCAYENRERSVNFTTYLYTKSFTFENSQKENEVIKKKLSIIEAKNFMNSWGVHVSDIRLKITNIDGSVQYRQIFNPENERRKYIPYDITQFNLIYRKGIEFILNILHKEELIPSVLQIFKFKDGQDRISELNLEQLYEFFNLIGIKFVNVLDSSCRSFHPKLQMTGEKADKLYLKEKKFNKKPEAFGKRSNRKRSNRKRSNRKRSRKRSRKLSNHNRLKRSRKLSNRKRL